MDWVALDVGIHWLGNPWGFYALTREDQVDVLAYRETLLANDEIRAEVRVRARRRQLQAQDLRLLSVAPMSEGDYLHGRMLLMPRKGGAREPRQVSGEQQFMRVLAQRGDTYWQRRIAAGSRGDG